MDVSGEQQNDISASVYKVRLDKEGNKISDSKLGKSIEFVANFIELGVKKPTENSTDVVDPNYCGDCYGGDPKITEENPKGCCNTCEAVREAYQRKGWSFSSPDNIDQCIKEGYVDKMREQANEGCNINGHLEVSRVAGNFHFAPGKSFQQAHMHVHDLHQFMQQMSGEDPNKYDFSHIVHYLSFGEVVGFGNPLDGISRTTKEGLFRLHSTYPFRTSHVPILHQGCGNTIQLSQWKSSRDQSIFSHGTRTERLGSRR